MKSILILLSAISIGFIQCKEKTVQKDNPAIGAWNTVKTINRYWAITEDIDSLSMYLHKDMVIYFPGGKERMEGKEAILESYREYMQSAETLSLEENEPLVQVYNNDKTAVVTYFSVLQIKTKEGEIQTFRSKDMYTLIFENNRWYAVAQHYSFY